MQAMRVSHKVDGQEVEVLGRITYFRPSVMHVTC